MSWLNIFHRKTKEEQFDSLFAKHDTGVYMTPDAPVLEAKPEHLVIIYDDMMFNRSEWPVIEHMVKECLGPGLALVAVEAFISKSSGRVVAIPAHNGARPEWSLRKGAYGAPIRGSIYKVPPSTILELDKLYGNNVYYRRLEVACEKWKVKQGTRPYLEMAWIYIGRPEAWEIDGGYEWESIKINPPNFLTAEKHYYHTLRKS